MKKKAGSYIVVGLLVLLCGCSTTTKQFVPLPDQSKGIDNPQLGRIYVMRPSDFANLMTIRVDDGSKTIGHIGAQSYLCWEREPGDTEIRGHAGNTVVLTLTVNKGESYYIWQYASMGRFRGQNNLRLLDTAEGKAMLNGCKAPMEILGK